MSDAAGLNLAVDVEAEPPSGRRESLCDEDLVGMLSESTNSPRVNKVLSRTTRKRTSLSPHACQGAPIERVYELISVLEDTLVEAKAYTVATATSHNPWSPYEPFSPVAEEDGVVRARASRSPGSSP